MSQEAKGDAGNWGIPLALSSAHSWLHLVLEIFSIYFSLILDFLYMEDFFCFYVFFFSKFIYLKGQSDRERDLHLLILSPDALNSHGWIRQKPET